VRETLERLYRGDLKARAEEGRDDEIGAVARSLNLWAGEVERRLHLLPASGMAFPPELSLERVDLSTLLHESLARHRDELARRCVGVELAPTPGACVVLADRDRLREALELLLRQALASLPERGGRLGIRTLPSLEPSGFVRLEVADDGPGMDDQQRRLALGEMDEDGATPPTPGFAPVRALADRLGGRMALYSEPGRGSVVQLLLPCG
jgi:signal transduction histidine kinase